ncbi:hypothetical protein P389DRAFT_8667 [Cystobasidium minutum MCA 4210]|uniref:uncharacterized protein n=1 Tax=Cystobasidium minutum MCA 4210 TaxID=1397322 RepID=UPI0034CDD158|eukprot:jgi/Rhomi1/8667/CE8666_135
MATCVSSVVVGFLIPMLMCISFLVACFITRWFGTAQRRKAKQAEETLIREKDAFKEREIATQQAAVQRYMEEMEKWKKEAEINRAASDEYKRLLDINGVNYQRQTMLFGSPDSSNASEHLKTTMNN